MDTERPAQIHHGRPKTLSTSHSMLAPVDRLTVETLAVDYSGQHQTFAPWFAHEIHQGGRRTCTNCYTNESKGILAV